VKRFCYGYKFAEAAPVTEPDNAGRQCKQRVIFATANVFTRFKMGTTLANDNGPGIDKLAVLTFYAKALSVTVSAVSGTSLSFLMSHSLPLDSFNFQNSQQLAMTFHPLILFPSFLLEHENLFAFLVFQDFGCNVGTVHVRGTDFYTVVLSQQPYLFQINGAAFIRQQPVNDENLAFDYLMLLALGFHYCVHVPKSSLEISSHSG
jgi:hypothetical protein